MFTAWTAIHSRPPPPPPPPVSAAAAAAGACKRHSFVRKTIYTDHCGSELTQVQSTVWATVRSSTPPPQPQPPPPPVPPVPPPLPPVRSRGRSSCPTTETKQPCLAYLHARIRISVVPAMVPAWSARRRRDLPPGCEHGRCGQPGRWVPWSPWRGTSAVPGCLAACEIAAMICSGNRQHDRQLTANMTANRLRV